MNAVFRLYFATYDYITVRQIFCNKCVSLFGIPKCARLPCEHTWF